MFSADRKCIYIILSVSVFSGVVTWIDAVIHPDYFLKIPIKILFFLALPMLFFLLHREEAHAFRDLFSPKREGLRRALLLGLLIYAVILGGYLLTRELFDFSRVTSSLTEGMGITADNFLYVSLYISLLNSFLEEFFFRGFGFMTLKHYTGRKFAYVFSSLLFAVYHIGMLLDMFQAPILALLLAGLIAGGCIFSALNEHSGCIYPSWFAHMFANFAINTVGFLLFRAG